MSMKAVLGLAIIAHLEMSQLPCTCQNQNQNLRNTVPDSARIGRLAQVSVIRLALPLVLLLAADVLQFVVEIADLGSETRNMRPVVLDVRLGGSDDDIQIKADVGVAKPRRVIR